MVRITTQFPPNLSKRCLAVMLGLLALNIAFIVWRWDSVIVDMSRHDLSTTNTVVLLYVLLTTLWVAMQTEDRFRFVVPAERARAS